MAAENFKVKKGLEVGTGSTITSDGVNVTGIVTATQFKGDGSGLTGVVGSGSGVVIKDEGSAVGTAGTINFVGSGIAAAISEGTATVTVSGITTANVATSSLVVTGISTITSQLFSGKVKISSNVNALSSPSASGAYHLHLTNPNNDLNETVGIAFGLSTGGDIGAAITHEREGSTSFGNLRFYTKENNNPATMLERMRISKEGNIGINSSNPTSKLDVVGENGSTVTFKSAVNPHLLVTSDANLNEYQYQSVRNGVTIKSTEARLDLIAEGSGTHAGSFLIRDNSHDGFGFVNDFTNKELQLKSFTSSSAGFSINSTGSNVSRLDNCIVIKKDGSVKLFNDGNLSLETTGSGVNIPGVLDVSAMATISGVLEVIGNANISNDLDVDGTSDLDQVNIAQGLNVTAGIATFAADIDANADMELAGNLAVTGVSTFAGITTVTGDTLFTKQLNVSGISTFGSSGQAVINDNGNITATAITISDGQPGLFFVDTGADPDFVIQNRDGTFAIRSIVPNQNRFLVDAANGDVTVTGNIAGDNSTNISGIASVTATSFHGSGAGLTSIPSAQLTGALPSLDGSALTGITASGSGVIVQHDGSNVGTAGTINFSTNLDVSPIHAGIVTVTASGGSGISTANVVTDTLNVAGVVTATGADINGNSIISGYLNVEATSGNSGALNVKGAENQDAYIQLVADEGDNNGDNWLIRHDHSSSNKLEFQNDISGTYVDKFTLSTGGDATISGSVVVGSAVTVNSGGVDAPTGTITGYNLVANNRLTVDSGIYGTAYVLLRGGDGGDTDYYSGGNSYSEHIFRLLQSGSSITRFRINRYGVVVSGVATATSFVGSGASITSLNADELDSGEIPSGRFPSTLPAVSGANLTNLTAGNISGTLASSQIADEAITFAKMQHVGTGVLIGRNDSGSGDIETLTAAEARTLLNVADGATAGITTAPANVQVTWSVTANGSSAYRFTGPGNDGSDDNPDLYLVRGQRYRFINNSGGSHPFRITLSDGGAAYNTGVTNNNASSGNIDFNVQHDAPTRLYYQCTSHNGMIGNIYITGGASWQTTDVNTSTTEEIFTLLNVGIGTDDPDFPLHVFHPTSNNIALFESGDAFATMGLSDSNGSISFLTTLGGLRINVNGDAGTIGDNSTLAMGIKNNGYVGIGTDNPVSLLTLGADANPNLTFLDYTNNAQSQILGSAGGQLVFQTDINSVNPNSDFIFRADSVSNEIVRFKDSGEVGIGTNNPDGQLHISSGTSGDCRVYIEADTDNNNEGDNPFIIFKNDGGHENASVWCGNASGTNDNSLNLSAATSVNGGIRFFTSSTDGGWETADERARITSAGQLLINAVTARGYVDGGGYTQTPKLQVESSSNTDTAISLRYDSGAGADARRASFIFARTADGTAVSNDSVLGEVLFMGEGNNTLEKAASIRAEVDNTPGTNDMPGRLIFSTSADGSDSPTERLRIDSNGRVLIGHNSTPATAASVAIVGSYIGGATNTPFVYVCRDEDATSITANESLGQILFASKDGYRGAVIESKAAGAWSGSSSDGYLQFKTTPDNTTVPVVRLTITSSGNATLTGSLTQNSSDIRLKENIQPITNSLEKVKSLSGFTYNWNKTAQDIGFKGEEHDELQVGLSAQDVEKIQPEVVKPAPIDNNFKTIQYEKLVPLLVEAIKEQQEQIEILKTEISALKSS